MMQFLVAYKFVKALGKRTAQDGPAQHLLSLSFGWVAPCRA